MSQSGWGRLPTIIVGSGGRGAGIRSSWRRGTAPSVAVVLSGTGYERPADRPRTPGGHPQPVRSPAVRTAASVAAQLAGQELEGVLGRRPGFGGVDGQGELVHRRPRPRRRRGPDRRSLIAAAARGSLAPGVD